MREDATFDSHVAGIPCGVLVTDYTAPKPWKQHTFRGAGPGDCDPPEYEDVEFCILDRKGYFAEWLEKKMTREDFRRISAEACDAMNEEPDYGY